MQAAVVHAPGGPEVLQIEEVPLPQLRPGWVRVRISAFGLTRSEVYARRGDYPEVAFPRILGTECVGVVDDALPDAPVQRGQMVAAVMGGMGRLYDGCYAEYALLPATQVMPLVSTLPWTTLAAIPKTFLTAQEALDVLDLRSGQTLLIRGGTSSTGMAALSLANDLGVSVLATTRNPAKATALSNAGARHVLIDRGEIADEVERLVPGGVNTLLELVGATTLGDSLLAVASGGTLCYMGVLGENAVVEQFRPLSDIPTGVRMTSYASRATINATNCTAPLQRIVDGVAAGRYQPNLDRIFPFEQIAAAHRYIESNQTVGKVVVTLE